MYSISKEFSFSASHMLTGLPPSHQCSRLHGHNYIVVVTLAASALQHPGFVVDYAELALVKAFLDTEWDHRHLNDVAPFSDGLNPTAEHMAQFLAEHFSPVWPELLSVRVSETPKTWAEYTINGKPYED